MSSPPPLDFPEGEATYLLHNAFVPECCLDLRGAFERQREPGRNGDDDDGDTSSRRTKPTLLRSESTSPDLDSLVHVDIEVEDGVVKEICRARPRGGAGDGFGDHAPRRPIVDAGSGIILPCFVDLHTHIGKEIEF